MESKPKLAPLVRERLVENVRLETVIARSFERPKKYKRLSLKGVK